jgi:hypothetical protein
MDFKPTEAKISLHGLGFIQLVLGGNQRLHVWHPDLPRRRCFEHSQVHDHRFGFVSRVLVGEQENSVWAAGPVRLGEDMFTQYRHEGPRTEFGNRPWTPSDRVALTRAHLEVVRPGEQYEMRQYVFHSTRPLGDGRVATLMRKVYEGDEGATSLCRSGFTPDKDFDRLQLSETELWNVVREVLSCG